MRARLQVLDLQLEPLREAERRVAALDPLSRPQSVFALQKELSREIERRYTTLSFSERLKLQIENLKSGTHP